MDTTKVTKKRLLIGFLLVLVFSSVITIYLFGGRGFDIHYAIYNSGGDETSFMSEIKIFLDSGIGYKTEYLGGVFGTDRSGTLSYYLDNDVHFLAYIFAKITNNIEEAINLTFISSFFLNGLICYFVLASRKIHPYLSAAGAALYETQFYVFYRSIGHLMLSMIYSIPLEVLLCLWIGEDEEYLAIGKGFFKNKKNIITILIIILMVNSGMGYYLYYGCLLIAITGIGKAIKNNRLLEFWQSLKMGVMTVVIFLITILPYILNRLINKTISIPNIRSITDAELYSLKIFRLFFPLQMEGVSAINDKLQEYYEIAYAQSEVSEYLGLVGVIGVVMMAVVLIRGTRDAFKYKDVKTAALLTIFCILYATIGGLGTVVYLFVMDLARCTNRMSVYICFLCILTICTVFDVVIRDNRGKRRQYSRLILVGLICFVLCFLSQWNQERFNNEEAKLQGIEMKTFVSRIEEIENEGSLIYQFPFNNYPSSGYINRMYPDALLLPYLYSDNLRWSYGSFAGEKSYSINEKIATLNMPDLARELKKYGFSGVYVDSMGYSDYELQIMTNDFEANGLVEAAVSSSGRWLYYDFE